ncbi:hypothetical protein F4778DRAFT_331309 [Xylariomycetidae sp. FL2044]|nr:hypothetical protein F4778DRAFT_331309 [Xylariomycetidae sp. FL2044]
MASRKALAAARCSQCRLAFLDIFTNPAPKTPLLRAGGLYQSRARIPPSTHYRTFSSFPKSDFSSDKVEIREEHINKDDSVDEAGSKALQTQTDAPWYLQVEPPRHVASTEPPPLPEVPADSPAIIASLLEYASEEMGLDSLSLLDLRKLDPAPALGPNLFMLFGTARSERHLNVSAGRLLRWLRAKHRIWADADGLLGPNERKTKLRRKAKRAKLLGIMGNDDADDGIKTGWICVNLGNIGRGGEESAIVADDGRVAGFGVSQPGFTVVFQVMTERRRAELNLEELWQNALEPSKPELLKSQPKEQPRLHPLEEAILANSQSSSSPQDRNVRHRTTGQAQF